jgi:YlmC/YmxH family sporulation protein
MRIADLRYKEVINISTGQRLGCVSDVDMDEANGRVTSLIVPGAYKFFGIFGREPDVILPWESILKIGEDIILVNDSVPGRAEKTKTQIFSVFLL